MRVVMALLLSSVRRQWTCISRGGSLALDPTRPRVQVQHPGADWPVASDRLRVRSTAPASQVRRPPQAPVPPPTCHRRNRELLRPVPVCPSPHRSPFRLPKENCAASSRRWPPFVMYRPPCVTFPLANYVVDCAGGQVPARGVRRPSQTVIDDQLTASNSVVINSSASTSSPAIRCVRAFARDSVPT